MNTTTEQERAAYIAGDTDKAALLARIAQLERDLATATARLEEYETDLFAARHERAYL
jgi:hypothetical protein